MGLKIVAEHYRAERDSYKLDLALPDGGQIELFSFPSPPARPSFPEACGLRHLAFAVDDLDACVLTLAAQGIVLQAIRVDEYTGQRFVFLPTQMGCRWSCMSASLSNLLINSEYFTR